MPRQPARGSSRCWRAACNLAKSGRSLGGVSTATNRIASARRASGPDHERHGCATRSLERAPHTRARAPRVRQLDRLPLLELLRPREHDIGVRASHAVARTPAVTRGDRLGPAAVRCSGRGVWWPARPAGRKRCRYHCARNAQAEYRSATRTTRADRSARRSRWRAQRRCVTISGPRLGSKASSRCEPCYGRCSAAATGRRSSERARRLRVKLADCART